MPSPRCFSLWWVTVLKYGQELLSPLQCYFSGVRGWNLCFPPGKTGSSPSHQYWNNCLKFWFLLNPEPRILTHAAASFLISAFCIFFLETVSIPPWQGWQQPSHPSLASRINRNSAQEQKFPLHWNGCPDKAERAEPYVPPRKEQDSRCSEAVVTTYTEYLSLLLKKENMIWFWFPL